MATSRRVAITLGFAIAFVAIGLSSGRAADPPGASEVIEGYREAAAGVLVGGEPKTRAAFEALRRAGVKTIVSVDGATPDVEAARACGLRYVHIPIGYDGVPPDAQAALAAVMKTRERPVFVHCHHGKHRGPAAAAVACRAAGLLDAAQAKRLLEEAGTSPDYVGLWQDVDEFRPADERSPAPELVESADVGHQAAAMAMIDRAFDRLKSAEKSGWPAREANGAGATADARVVEEGFVESLRSVADSGGSPNLRDGLAAARDAASRLRAALGSGDGNARDESFRTLDASCKSCHRVHRDAIEFDADPR